MAKFDLNDSGVVVIVGSGAGGGTLGNELAQKGVKVVILEAGSRIEMQDFVNDEWESFTQLAWSDMRTTSGSWRVAKDFANLPAWIVKAVGGSTTHWAGASLRFDEHEFKAKTTTAASRRQSAGLADHARRDGAVVRQGRGQDGRHPHQRHCGAARQQQFQGDGSGEEARLQDVHTGNMAINSAARDGRGACQQIGFCFQGCKSARNGRRSIPRSPGARRPAISRCAPTAW